MRNFILSLIATIVVMIVSPPNPNIIADSPHFIETTKLITPLEPVAYAQKQEMVKVPVATPKPVTTAPSGSCGDWMAQAGISDPDAVWLISKESGCNPNAQNPRSTAYGIFQFLDGTWKGVGCVKTSDPVEQMRCGTKYVMARYGSWAKARSFHAGNGWY